jgi:OOP family OmpA-OmpF porin
VNRRRKLSIGAAAAVTVLGLACAGQTLSGKVDGYDKILQEAIGDGSKTIGCAPKETAIAEANIRFARDALTMGEYYRGKDHTEKAEIYSTLARKKTDPVRCKDPKAVRDAGPKMGDRDGDGYDDKVDKCPDDPEDFDSFEDDDGCPDKDNDKDGILDAVEYKDGKWSSNDKKLENGRENDCRNEPEDMDGFEDEDGCPGPGQRPRHPARRRRQVPERARGLRPVRGPGRLPGHRQRRRQGARRR